MVYKRRKMFESQKRDYIQSGDITRTQIYKRPKLTEKQQKELYDKGSITITVKTRLTIKKGFKAPQQVKQHEKAYKEYMNEVKKNHDKNLSIQQKNQTMTYIRWGFVKVYPDGTSDPNNEQGYRMYPGHPDYNYIIHKHIKPEIIENNVLWQGGFVIKTFINIKKDDNTYDILDEYEYKQ